MIEKPIQNAIPNLFGQPELSSDHHQKLLKDFGDRFGVEDDVYGSYGPKVWIPLCETVVFRHIWHMIEDRFCVGADETLEALGGNTVSPKVSIENALTSLENISLTKKPDSKCKFMAQTPEIVPKLTYLA